MLDRLAAWKSRYGVDPAELEQLLDAVAQQSFSDPSELIKLHETLLFLRAYPQSEGVARRAEAMLAEFGGRVAGVDAAAFEDPEVSGIAGTSLTAVFSYEVAGRLAKRHPDLRIDWEAYDEPNRMGPVLRRIIPMVNEDWPVEAHPPFRQWMAGRDLHWLLKQIARLGLSERDRGDLYDSMQLPLYWELGRAEHTRSRVYGGGHPLFVHTEPLLRRRDVSFEGPPLAMGRMAKREATRVLDVILDTSAIRFRELYGFTHPDAAHLYRVKAGRGLVIYFFGIPREWRLPLRAYHAGMFFKNGVPAGYIEVLSLAGQAEIGFNLYYTFREGETAWVYARLAQLCREMLGVKTIVVDPYQIGRENEEAIESGAFWFYRKLGFHSTDPATARLIAREEQRMAVNPGYRSSRATLRKLAQAPIQLGDSRAIDWRRLAMTPDVKRLLPAIRKAKQAPEETVCLRRMQTDSRWRKALEKLIVRAQ